MCVIMQGLSWAGAGGPARPVNFSCHGPRPGPAHQIFIWWAAARPSPSNFQSMGRGPARPINFSEDGPWPGPTHHIFKFSRPGPARPITFSKISARPGPAHQIFLIGPGRPGLDNRPMTSPDKYIRYIDDNTGSASRLKPGDARNKQPVLVLIKTNGSEVFCVFFGRRTGYRPRLRGVDGLC